MDKKQIVDTLKSEGLDVAEDLAATAARAAIKLMEELLPQVSKGFGLAFNLFIEAYKPRLFDLIDKIDGKKDLEY